MEQGRTLKDIQTVLKRKLAVQATHMPGSDTEVRFILPMVSNVTPPSAPFGILLTRPELPLFSKEIAPHLNYLHHASGKHIDFFCAGYRKDWLSEDDLYKDARLVQEISQVGWMSEDWFYSDQAFVELIHDLESASKWKYNGGSVLLLLSSKLLASGELQIDFSQTIQVTLEDAIEEGAIKNVHRFIQRIIRMAQENKRTWNMSDNLGFRSISSSFLNELIERDPTGVGKATKNASYFASHDYSINESQ
tara:strand:- start:14219 stop:14965 length:747 start_codon:yes stop_codon:yes gene_type:complete